MPVVIVGIFGFFETREHKRDLGAETGLHGLVVDLHRHGMLASDLSPTISMNVTNSSIAGRRGNACSALGLLTCVACVSSRTNKISKLSKGTYGVTHLAGLWWAFNLLVSFCRSSQRIRTPLLICDSADP